MPKFKIVLHYEEEIEAEYEELAEEKFWNNTVFVPQQTSETFITDHLKIKAV